jgi:hypothetical protein
MKTALAPSMADYARVLCGNFADRLIVMDQLQHSQLYPIIAGAHLVVLPSLIDDLPNACLEGGAAKVTRIYAGENGRVIVDLLPRSSGPVIMPFEADAP